MIDDICLWFGRVVLGTCGAFVMFVFLLLICEFLRKDASEP